MRDIIDTINDWMSDQRPIAIATVVSTWGSSPRQSGSKMAVRADGTMVGSVSGGCVEGAVTTAALDIIEGADPQLLKFGVPDDTAWDVGLACGGSIEVFVQMLDRELFIQAAKLIDLQKTFAMITCIEGSDGECGEQVLIDSAGAFVAGQAELLEDLHHGALISALERGGSGRLDITSLPGRAFFIDVISPPKKLILVGGVHISIALANIAHQLGYRTIVVDPRRLFATDERFPAVDQLLRAWPLEAYQQIGLDRETAIAVLTHDPKIDDPAVIGALEHPVFYIGVLGSRKTHASRLERLRQAGCDEQQLDRLHAPIGLHIGAQSPEEIALSIMAEIVAAEHSALDR
jgi:xanthine dehydrogenase accessory factor